MDNGDIPKEDLQRMQLEDFKRKIGILPKKEVWANELRKKVIARIKTIRFMILHDGKTKVVRLDDVLAEINDIIT